MGASERIHSIVKAALLYHRRGMSQAEVAKALGLSQARVSQLLRAAAEQRIVETVVHVPPGMFSELEDELERRFELERADVVEVGASDGGLKRALGAAAAPFVRLAMGEAGVVGVSAWSETLLGMVESMEPLRARPDRVVVNVFGGVASPGFPDPGRLMQGLAGVCGARSSFLLGPGVLAEPSLRDALRREPQVQEVVSLYDRLSLLLVGVGALVSEGRPRPTGYLSAEDEAELRALGAVGDITLHFFDARGRPVHSALAGRLLGIGLDQLRRVPRVIAVAGGRQKLEAIRAALRGHWVHWLITDHATARALVQGAPARPRS